ncbi:helicase HerA-like domain-containing protein [Falsarthrobacter nasiphocae]|uniref:DNA helicase HerA-like ATPase n=1 Tax=Falsarthrobacter nasiphocae TaxID=189863 RepID=A0AAE3YHS0_9MICC|nr:helicase HerA-like domain-containing protein [Falsarthrobacter nasiphocae]MDR6892271.1 DNA helicase HerA-like ATPase [Falsarthrobacter nasiphocae]
MATDDQLSAISTGYTFTGEVIRLGAALTEGQPHPEVQVGLPLSMMTRHGLVAGATGTGKTKTLQSMAEQLSAHGVPVFLADMKGDLSGLAAPGEANEKLTARTQGIGQDWAPASFPVEFYALGGDGQGVPVRATVSSFGPILLSRVMDLNETQESSLQLIFHYADQNGLELYNLADLRAVIQYLTSPDGKAALADLGGLSKATAGVILRELVGLEADGMDAFFGEPEFDTSELLRTAADGRGIISALELSNVQAKPQLFSTFLMWLLADLFQDLPEVGDVDKPKLVFFLDEAHLLFNGASKAFLSAITQTVRLIRSKGVGIFFVTQTPKDVPADVLGQLANRVQHALRAFTPDDQKALTATVKTFPKSGYDLESVLTSAGIGEAVVTVMTETGAPSPVAWTRMFAPQSRMAPAPEAIAAAVSSSPLMGRYGTVQDSYSAFEKLRDARGGGADATAGAGAGPGEAQGAPDNGGFRPYGEGAPAGDAKAAERAAREERQAAERAAKEEAARQKAEERERQKRNDAIMRVGTNVASTLGREIVRSVFGTSRSRSRKGGGGLLGGLFG